MEQVAVVVSAGIPKRGNSHRVQGLSSQARRILVILVVGEWQLAVIVNAEKCEVPLSQHGLVVYKPFLWQTDHQKLPICHLQVESSNGQQSQGARGHSFCPDSSTSVLDVVGQAEYSESGLNPDSSNFLIPGLWPIISCPWACASSPVKWGYCCASFKTIVEPWKWWC